MSKKIEVFGKSFNEPRAIASLSGSQPEPFGGIPSGVFAVFAVLILALSLNSYFPEDESPPSEMPLTEAQTTYLETILSDRSRSSPILSNYDSCGFLEMDLKDHLKEEMRVNLGTGYASPFGNLEMWTMDEDVGILESTASPEKSSSDTQEGNDYSGTNNQEQGVDEADFVKTDGSYIYLVNQDYNYWDVYPSGNLHIFDIPEAGNISYLSNITIEGHPKELLLVDDKAIIYSNVYIYSYYDETHPLDPYVKVEYKKEKPHSVESESKEESNTVESSDSDGSRSHEEIEYEYDYYYRTTSLTKLTVLDLTNRSSPQISKELYIEGGYQTARESKGTVRMVSYGWMDVPELRTWLDFDYSYWELDWESSERELIWMEKMNETVSYNDKIIDSVPLDNLLPRIYERSGQNITVHKYSESGAGNCQNFAASSDGAGRGISSILTLDLLNENFSFNADHILSNQATVYASGDVLLLAESAWDSWWFWWGDEISENNEMTNIHVFNISGQGQTDYVASGRINGTINNQFSLSEYEGYIRVCSTTGQWGRWWIEDPEPMENHVFVLGLSTHGNEYEVVGHVGGIAKDESIWSSRFVGEKAYLVTFRNIDPLWTIDLSNPTNPKVIGELEIPGVSTYIHPMGENHLLTIGIGGNDDGLEWGVTQVSIFDVSDFSNPQLTSSMKLTPEPQGAGYSYSEATYEHKAFQYWEEDNLLAVPLSTSRWFENGYEYVSKLQLINAKPDEELTLYSEVDHSLFYRPNYWWDNTDIRRSIFMGGGDYIYAISEKAITSHKVDTMEMIGFAEIPSNNKPAFDESDSKRHSS